MCAAPKPLIVVVEDEKELAGLIASARFVCLPGHGHAVLERSHAARGFIDAVAAFMAEAA